jgi:hypothetical protein
MSEPMTDRQPRRVLRSIGAVLAGLIAIIVLAGAIDAAFRAAGVYPPLFQPMADDRWALALATRVVAGIVGGMLTARLAPARPMRYVVVLGCIGTLLRLMGVLFTWNKGPEFGPLWFSISVAVSALPCTMLGGRLISRRNAGTNP